MSKPDKNPLHQLNRRIIRCERCPRLRAYCRKVAGEKRASFRDERYFGKPVPNFVPPSGPADPGVPGIPGVLGVPGARLLVVGLAPAAHGANRTGRMFTGDRSGAFLFRAMYEAGFCSQPTCEQADDGLALRNVVITAAVHCAPPANKPTGDEMANCAPWLDETFNLMPNLRVVVCLGRIALDAVLRLYKRRGWIEKLASYKFAHGGEHRINRLPTVLCSYHPSQQNTFTGRLTERMLLDVFERAQWLIEDDEG